MELNTINLSDFVKIADMIFMKGLEGYSMVAKNSGLFRTEDIPDNSGNAREYTEIDLEQYARRKGENDQAAKARQQQGYSKTATLQRIGHNVGISWEMRHQNKYPQVISVLTNLGRTVAQRMELDLQHRLTFGTATTYTNMDGESVDIAVGDTLALFSTAHTIRGASTTFRNILANNPLFSRGALEGMEQLIAENSINQFGEKISVAYDVIWTADHASSINTMREFLKSTASPDANNNGVINVYQGKYRLVVLPLVATTNVGVVDTTKAKYWGLASTTNSQAYVGVNENPHLMSNPTESSNAEDVMTDEWQFRSRASYFISTPGARWVTLSRGDGQA